MPGQETIYSLQTFSWRQQELEGAHTIRACTCNIKRQSERRAEQNSLNTFSEE